MIPAINLQGKRFGRLLVEKRAPTKGHGARWYVVCDCGVRKSVQSSCLRLGYTRSCGCLNLEVARSNKHGLKHGHYRSAEYRAWRILRARCNNPKDKDYRRYGGRGIYVDPSWDSFPAFLASVGPRPSPEHSIERVKNDGPYAPGNCRWATRSEQQRNKRSNRLLTLRGETKPIVAWAEQLKMGWQTLMNRVNAGWSEDRLLSEPVHARQPSTRLYQPSHYKNVP
jgi:hypothetical protein